MNQILIGEHNFLCQALRLWRLLLCGLESLFFSIISKEKLLSYAKAVEISENLILIELFDLSEPITSDEKKQQRFWEFFKLYSVAKKYEEENDVTESLTDFFKRISKK